MNSENKIYIHADDYGYTKSMSSKILDCVNDGKVNSISIMIDGNSEALTKIKGIKNTEIRLHLNLTSINSVGNQMHKEKLLKLYQNLLYQQELEGLKLLQVKKL